MRLTLLAALLAASGCRAESRSTPGALPVEAGARLPSATGSVETAAVSAAAPLATASAPAPATTADASAAPASPCPEGMAWIPGGTYRMQKRRPRTTDVAAFCIDLTEVTVAAYKACVRERRCSPECLAQGTCSAVPTQAEWGEASESRRASRFCNGDRDDRQDHPVNCVSWDESLGYCTAQGKRLPRPEEWEWAARRADPKMWYPWGNDPPDDQLCWSPKKHRHEGTCAVKSSPRDKTPQGVFDLGGDVAEWVDGAPAPGTRIHVAFGASWWAMDDGYVSGALGGIEVPGERNETVGFRCARDPAPETR